MNIQGLFECLKGSSDDIVLGTPSHGQQNAFVSERGNYHHSESSTLPTAATAMKAVLTYYIDSFAAWWQSMYGGLMPAGSLFS
jgi:hypothetical protein